MELLYKTRRLVKVVVAVSWPGIIITTIVGVRTRGVVVVVVGYSSGGVAQGIRRVGEEDGGLLGSSTTTITAATATSHALWEGHWDTKWFHHHHHLYSHHLT